MALEMSGRSEHVLDIAMAPVLTFDLGNRCNIPCAKCVCVAGEKDDDEAAEKGV